METGLSISYPSQTGIGYELPQPSNGCRDEDKNSKSNGDVNEIEMINENEDRESKFLPKSDPLSSLT